MVCPNCHRFPAFEPADPEVELEIDEEGKVTGSARIVLTCAECGTELKETTFDVEIDLTEEVGKHKEANPKCEGVELDDPNGEFLDRSETTTTKIRKDGTVKVTQVPCRYQKRFYGCAVTVRAKCECEKEPLDVEGSWQDEVQAGGMEELV